MVSILQSGGSFMYVILCVSIVAVALFCERFNYLYFRLKLDADKAIKRILHPLEKANFRAALQECGRIESHPLGRILKAGLLKSDKLDRDIEKAMEEKIMREIPAVKGKTNLLAVIANISTLLGLLGTILGLIGAFEGVSAADAATKQEVLARGISVAMLTTAFGLIVSVPCIVGFYILNNRGDEIIDEMEEKAMTLYNSLCSLKREQGRGASNVKSKK